MQGEEVKINSCDYWFKIVEFLQQNWALIDETEDGRFIIYFLGDTSGIFDQIESPTLTEAEQGLIRNGFRRYSEDLETQKFVACPSPPFYQCEHPNGFIYSSGRFWVR